MIERDEEYDTAGRQLQDALRAAYPDAKWAVGDSVNAKLNAMESEIPWESARRGLTVCAEKDGYAQWIPAPLAATLDTPEGVARMVGERALYLLQSMREGRADE